MRDQPGCYYCSLNAGPDESEHFIRLWTTEDTIVYLHRDQSLPGRAVVAASRHAADITELPLVDYRSFFDTVRGVGRAIRSAYPLTEKINLSLCGNAQHHRHPHMHVLPRFTDDRRWPEFVTDHQQPYWPPGDLRYQEALLKLRRHL